MPIAFNGTSAQIIQLANCPVFRGRASVTVGGWLKIPATPSALVSYWRQDGVFTPIQWEITNNRMRAAWWDTTNTVNNVPPTAHAAVAANTWTFFCTVYGAAGITCWSYVPGSAPATTGVTEAYESRIAPSPLNNRPMLFGGTELNGELAPSGTKLGELVVVNGVVPARDLALLAHEPQRFEHAMLFYAPLRSPDRRTVPLRGRSYAMQYGTAAQSLVGERDHPPVEKWRTGRSVCMGVPFYASASLNIRARRL